MAAKKYYAVKKGKKTGIFRTWDECKASVDSCPGAEYKGFAQLEEAESYLGIGLFSYPCPETAVSEDGVRSATEDDVSKGCSQGRRNPEVSEDGLRSVAEDDISKSSSRGRRKAEVSGDGLQSVIEDGISKSSSRGRKAEVSGDGLQSTTEDTVLDGGTKRGKESLESATVEVPETGTLLAYVDGSYDNSLKKYAFGCVFILPDGRICTEYGNGDNEQSLRHRNVTGEMLGAMFAVKTAMMSGFSKVEIRYDYEGIEKWVTGAWNSKTELTRKYAMSMREWGKSIKICFTKVTAHANVYYNELADKMAKTGLREGKGIPKLHSLMEERA